MVVCSTTSLLWVILVLFPQDTEEAHSLSKRPAGRPLAAGGLSVTVIEQRLPLTELDLAQMIVRLAGRGGLQGLPAVVHSRERVPGRAAPNIARLAGSGACGAAEAPSTCRPASL